MTIHAVHTALGRGECSSEGRFRPGAPPEAILSSADGLKSGLEICDVLGERYPVAMISEVFPTTHSSGTYHLARNLKTREASQAFSYRCWSSLLEIEAGS